MLSQLEETVQIDGGHRIRNRTGSRTQRGIAVFYVRLNRKPSPSPDSAGAGVRLRGLCLPGISYLSDSDICGKAGRTDGQSPAEARSLSVGKPRFV